MKIGSCVKFFSHVHLSVVLWNFTINNLICLILFNTVGFTSTFMLTSKVLMAIKMIEFDLFTCNTV